MYPHRHTLLEQPLAGGLTFFVRSNFDKFVF